NGKRALLEINHGGNLITLNSPKKPIAVRPKLIYEEAHPIGRGPSRRPRTHRADRARDQTTAHPRPQLDPRPSPSPALALAETTAPSPRTMVPPPHTPPTSRATAMSTSATARLGSGA